MIRLVNIYLIFFMSLSLLSCDFSDKVPEDSKPLLRKVRTTLIAPPAGLSLREFPGVVDSAERAELAFRVSGKIEKLLITKGAKVKKGQLLAELDNTDYKIQLKSRQAEYERESADYKRGQTLIKQGLIPRADLDKLKSDYVSSKARLEEAQQSVAYTKLSAPFAGVISKRFVENFEDISAMNPVYEIYNPQRMTVKVNIPENIMINARKGGEPEVYATFDAIPLKKFKLSVEEVSTSADEETKTFEVTFNLPNINDLNILPGMSVTVQGSKKASSTDLRKQIFIPAHAILEDNQGRYVFIVNSNGNSTGVVSRKNVTTGRFTGAGVEVKSGLAMGEQLITAGMSKMRDGLEVRLTGEN